MCPLVRSTSNQRRLRKVLEARVTADVMASSILWSEVPTNSMTFAAHHRDIGHGCGPGCEINGAIATTHAAGAPCLNGPYSPDPLLHGTLLG
jgi:hypothetical protein